MEVGLDTDFYSSREVLRFAVLIRKKTDINHQRDHLTGGGRMRHIARDAEDSRVSWRNGDASYHRVGISNHLYDAIFCARRGSYVDETGRNASGVFSFGMTEEKSRINLKSRTDFISPKSR